MSCENTYLWGESLGFFIQTCIYLFTALFAFFALRFTYNQVQLLKKQNLDYDKQARLRATMDLINSEQSDEALHNARYVFLKNIIGRDLAKIAYDKNIYSEECKILFKILNHYEFVAAAIFEGVIDKKMYLRLRQGIIQRDWDRMEDFVVALRIVENKPKLFIEFNSLVDSFNS